MVNHHSHNTANHGQPWLSLKNNGTMVILTLGLFLKNEKTSNHNKGSCQLNLWVLPAVPSVPSAPSAPAVPSVPSVQSVPSVPVVPSVPRVPAVPPVC